MKVSSVLKSLGLGLAVALMFVPQLPAQSKTQTLTGVVSDVMCGAHHKMANISPAACTRACAKTAGYALVVGDTVYKVKGHDADFDKYAAQSVTVRGMVDGDTITVSSVKPAKS